MFLNNKVSDLENDIHKKFPWIGSRRIRLPNGWFCLLENACSEIETLLSPDNPKDKVRYFFAAVRDYKLQLFLECKFEDEGKAKTLAVESLIEELRNLSEYICVNCGRDVDGINRKYHKLPTCGCAKFEAANNNQEDITAFRGLHSQIIDKQLTKVEIAIEKTEPVKAIKTTDIKFINGIDIFNISEVNQILEDVQNKYRDSHDANKVKATLNKLLKVGPKKVIQPIPNILDELEQSFPNFSEVTSMLQGIQALSSDTNMVKIPPTLLVGPPGLGKTMFAQALADSMNVPFRVLRMENQQGGAGLVGTSDIWSNSKAGLVFSLLTNENCANPIVVVDEVDKTNTNAQYNPLNSLYSLLESSSSKIFSDESLPDLTLDASKITWILTANNIDQIPEAILSRIRVFNIPSPTLDQAKKIVNNIYQAMLKDSINLRDIFNDKLNDEVINYLALFSPREIKLSIELALGRAALAKRSNLIILDFDKLVQKNITKFGFI